MSILVDTSLWIDFIRVKSPAKLKSFVLPYITAPDGVLIEPVSFEVLRNVKLTDNPKLEKIFEQLPLLQTPIDLWTEAAAIGLRCHQAGLSPGSIDLLIATTAIHHQLTLVTFDQDFLQLAIHSPLQVKLLQKPVLP